MITEGKDSKGKVAVLTAKLEACFGGSLDDDLDIGIALASLFDFVREINNLLDAKHGKQAGSGRGWRFNDADR